MNDYVSRIAVGFLLLSLFGCSNGGNDNSETESTDIEASMPVASISTQAINVRVGDRVELDGRDSSANNGQALSYQWSLGTVPQNSQVTLSGAESTVSSFTPDVEGTFNIILTVNNGQLDSEETSIAISAFRDMNDSYFKGVIDAEYSKSQDKLLIAEAYPNIINIYDAQSDSNVELDLVLPPTSVSVSPNGLVAAVSHDSEITVVDVANQSISKVISVSAPINDLAVSDNGLIYALSSVEFGIRTIDIALAQEVDLAYNATNEIRPGSSIRLNPFSQEVIIAYAQPKLEKYTVSGSYPRNPIAYPYTGSPYPTCGNLWLSADGARVYTQCSNIFLSNNLVYDGSFGELSAVNHATHSLTNEEVAVIPSGSKDTELQIYTDALFTFKEAIALPKFLYNGGVFDGHGKFVFYNTNEDQFYVIMQADESSAMVNDFGIVVY
ncbi:MAG: hypothetical protein HWE11_01980 [Gammaproteobacteria bacterium]|nr:hypothetical protein [Gammaproteobacteria bacterium]